MSPDLQGPPSTVAPLPPPLGRLAWGLLGLVALALAVLGVVFPIFPGLPFAILAALCFANVSTRVHARLAAVPSMGGVMQTWQRARHAPVRTQLRTAGSLTLLGLVETTRMAWALMRRLFARDGRSV